MKRVKVPPMIFPKIIFALERLLESINFNVPSSFSPQIEFNCGAVPKDLIESEFFGHTKGAFTDAKTEKTGKFELAHKGTIFLDEVGELSPEAQVKLLRALGEKEIAKVGGTKTIPVDVRVIAATNKDLEVEVQKGTFREDLYWRLAVLSVHLPPLRERKADIPLLCEYLIEKYNKEIQKETKGVSEQALGYLMNYSWPGNIRELESVIYEAMVLSERPLIEEDDLPLRIRGAASEKEDIFFEPGKPLSEAVQSATEKVEKRLIEKALEEAGGNRTKAAQKLGISRKTLFNKILQYKIQR